MWAQDTVNQLPSWPVETELVFTMGTNILMLTIQRPLVRTVIQDAIENLCAALLFTNAFPGVCVALTLIKDCLFTAADNHKPGAKSILERLTRDQEYLSTVTPLVSLIDFEIIPLTMLPGHMLRSV